MMPLFLITPSEEWRLQQNPGRRGSPVLEERKCVGQTKKNIPYIHLSGRRYEKQ
jgi:hypothetical protein